MSMLSFLFTLFLCISMPACHARCFRVVNMASGTQPHLSSKVQVADQRANKDTVQKLRENGESMTGKKTHSGAFVQNLKELHALLKEMTGVKFKGANSGVVQNKSPNPHEKQNKNPGFYSDYSRPRTRPPSHN
ncbi:uncharacterized protein LOC131146339 [Malania oleifera]|uniref:uncharacterized protein LOC131146339 n=1 Tax=Malania oleifera TaxID=397392 RepID=UPI0025AE6F69|nr:uncharacterized protein LOC131146339 [Malania oleifera]